MEGLPQMLPANERQRVATEVPFDATQSNPKLLLLGAVTKAEDPVAGGHVLTAAPF